MNHDRHQEQTTSPLLALRRNGSGQTDVPIAARSGVVAIAAGGKKTMALKRGGSIVAWGSHPEEKWSPDSEPEGLLGCGRV